MEALKLEKQPAKVSSLLGKMNTKSTAKKTSKIEIDNENVQLADEVLALLKESKDIQARLEIKQNEMIEKAREWYEKKRATENSVKYQGTDEVVTVTFRNQFTKIDYALMETLQQLPEYDKYFYEKRDIKLLETDDATIEYLINTLGDMFEKIFNVELSIGVCKDMNIRQFELPEPIKCFVKQFRPSIK